MNSRKFILCADARTGSHMLQSALNSHPDINCCGEILNKGSKDSLIGNLNYEEAIDSVFLNTKHSKNGFIIHRHRKDIPFVWEKLECDESILIIFVTRRDQLRRYGSLKKARQTKNWIEYSEKQENELKVEFVEREFIAENLKYQSNFSNAIKMFSNHTALFVDYDDMNICWSDTINTVQRFLDVETKELLPKTYKQGKYFIDNIFSNSNEISHEYVTD